MMRWDETDGTVSVFRQPCRQLQRPHRRPPGPADQLRASRPPRQPHRARRHASRCSPTAIEGKRLNSPNDVGREVRRLDLVHRSRPTASTATTRATRPSSEIGGCHVYRIDPRHGGGHPWSPTTSCSQRPRLLARRGAALHRRHRRDPRSGRPAPHPRLRRRSTARRCRGGEVFADLRRRALRRLPRRHARPRLDLGRRRRALLRPRRHADRQDPRARGGRQRLPSAAASATASSSARTTSLYALYLLLRGA